MDKFNEKNSDFYDLEYFLSLEYRYFSEAHSSRIKNIFKCLNHLDLKGKRGLDVGCGGGFLTKKLSQLGIKVIGTDYSQSAIQFAKERYPELDFLNVSAYEIDDLEVKDLEIITAFDIIEHLEHPQIFLKKIFKTLKPNGLLAIATDNEDYLFNKKPFNRLRNLLLRTSSSGRAYRLIKKVEAHRRQFKNYHQSHINVMSHKELKREIAAAGFKIVKMAIYPIVSVPILDFFSMFLPFSIKGDHQLIIAKKYEN